jgi:alkyl hydroperoxide reductase subunit AhpC
MTTRVIVAATALCAALLPGLSAQAGEQAPHSAGAYIRAVGQLKVGDAVPAFRAKDIYGAEVCLQDLLASGRKPLLAFWSVYCKACVDKFNAMVTVQSRFADRGIAMISVNTDGEYQKPEQEIRDFIADYEKKNAVKINFPVLYDERNWLPQNLKVEFLPTIISVDPRGRVAGFYQKFDEANEAEIVAGIEGLARELLALYPAGVPAAAPGVAPCPENK